MAGEQLVIDTENGSFRVDNSGVHVDALKMYITHNGTEYVTYQSDYNALTQAITTASDDIRKTIAEFYSSGYLSADKLHGVIGAQQAQMQSAAAGVSQRRESEYGYTGRPERKLS